MSAFWTEEERRVEWSGVKGERSEGPKREGTKMGDGRDGGDDRSADRQTMERDGMKQRRAGLREGGGGGKVKKRWFADKAFRGLMAERAARPRYASHSITSLLFHSWLQRPKKQRGPPPPPPSSLIMRSINILCAAALTYIIPLCFLLNNKYSCKPHLEDCRLQISSHAAALSSVCGLRPLLINLQD